jgi:hypothetical protein
MVTDCVREKVGWNAWRSLYSMIIDYDLSIMDLP